MMLSGTDCDLRLHDSMDGASNAINSMEWTDVVVLAGVHDRMGIVFNGWNEQTVSSRCDQQLVLVVVLWQLIFWFGLGIICSRRPAVADQLVSISIALCHVSDASVLICKVSNFLWNFVKL